MSADFDPETREIASPSRPATFPAEIAAAVVKVMAGVRILGKDDKNQFAKYDFASIDKFLTMINPLCAEAGLFFVMNEESYDVRKNVEGEKAGALCMVYSILMVHASGATWGPVMRHVIVTASGAQAFGTAQSYVLKQFMRSLFQIPTGDKDDADAQEAKELPSGGSRSSGARQATPASGGAQKAAAAKPADDGLAARQKQAQVDYGWIKRELVQCTDETQIDSVMISATDKIAGIKAVSPQGYEQLMRFEQECKDKLRAAGGDEQDELLP